MISTIFIKIVLLAGLVASSTIPRFPNTVLSPRDINATAVSKLLHIASNSITCENATRPSECRTATQAAPFLISSMQAWNITHSREISALLSVIAFNTDSFKFNTGKFAGQGTRNMQRGRWNLAYAQTFPELAAPLKKITGANFTDTAQSQKALSDAQYSAIVKLVLPDKFSWGSAAWFLTSQCENTRQGLRESHDPHAAYSTYLKCIGTEMSEERMVFWVAANEAFGLTSMAPGEAMPTSK